MPYAWGAFRLKKRFCWGIIEKTGVGFFIDFVWTFAVCDGRLSPHVILLYQNGGLLLVLSVARGELSLQKKRKSI